MGKRMTKDELIDWLIANDIDTVQQEIFSNDFSWLELTLREGFVGYRKQSYKELKQEYDARTGGEEL